jgi:signal transduction histidine kinase
LDEAWDKAWDRAERADEARRRMLTAVSHDLRQPLQALRLYLELLDGRLRDSADREALAGALSAQAAGEEILRHYLDIAALETGALDPAPGPVGIDTVIAGIVGECQPLAAAKSLDLRWVPCSATVISDAGLLRPMLRHLVVNAIRFTERGRVLIGCRRRGGRRRIEIWDTGIGIAAADLPHVFDEFYQIGNSERDRRKGLGLGLAVVARTARLLGHDIAAASRPGRGSVFALSLPEFSGLPHAPAVAPAPSVFLAPSGATGSGSLRRAFLDDPPPLGAQSRRLAHDAITSNHAL